MSLTIKNIEKTYGQQKVLNDVSFNINDNEIVGFLGPNGAGKSTTMKIITGFLTPDNGDVFGGTTLHNAISLYLLYEALYRSGGARLGVVALDGGCRSDDALLPIATARLTTIKEGVVKS